MKTVRAYFEGNDDKAILEALARVRLLPNGLELAKRDPEKGGKDGLDHLSLQVKLHSSKNG